MYHNLSCRGYCPPTWSPEKSHQPGGIPSSEGAGLRDIGVLQPVGSQSSQVDSLVFLLPMLVVATELMEFVSGITEDYCSLRNNSGGRHLLANT